MLRGATQALAMTDLTWIVEFWPVGLANAGSSMEDVRSPFESAGWVPTDHTWDHYLALGRTWSGHKACDLIVQHITRCQP